MKTKLTFQQMKQNKESIVMITAYDYPTAKLVEQAGVDMILVGDSLGMVVLGYDSTVPVTMEDMIHHSKAVRRGAKNTFIVVDMPFMSCHISQAETMRNAQRMMQETGANALKIEGTDELPYTISLLTKAGIPVIAHLGLTPQTVGVLGGYKVQGKDEESAKNLIENAKACEAAGAIGVLLECVPKQLGQYVSEILEIPVIGIGAGAETDGQVLVFHDIVGYGVERVPSFVKKYASIQETIVDSVEEYRKEVKERSFPTEEKSFSMKEEGVVALYGGK